MDTGFDDLSLFELFRMEAEEQVQTLQTELIQLETGAATAATLEALMRASHSLKGAARIVGLDLIVDLTHAMEDRFVKAQAGHALDSTDIDGMLRATDWLARLAITPEAETSTWIEGNTAAIQACAAAWADKATPSPQASLTNPVATHDPSPAPVPDDPTGASATRSSSPEDLIASPSAGEQPARERSVRIASDRFDQLLSLSSESLIGSHQLTAKGDLLERSRRATIHALQVLEDNALAPSSRPAALREMGRQIDLLAAHIEELNLLCNANERTSEQLYRTVLAGRLRPFSEGILGAARLVRDTARALEKNVLLQVLGESTRVDRDILERLEAPISHLLTNAIDHGIEAAAERIAAGKPAEARICLQARHVNGRLLITISDDGKGISRESLRQRILHRNLTSPEIAATLTDDELFEFLFLPGFSTRDQVSSLSGRGVGLNIVQSMVQQAGGSVTVSSQPGAGTTFRISLPVSRSVIKVIRVQVAGEFYAAPLARIDRVDHRELCVDPQSPGRATVAVDDRILPVIELASLLGFSSRPRPSGVVPMLLCGNFAFAVDRLVDQIELSVRQLDRRLGKIPGVNAASLDPNGLPLLILDIEDLIQTAHGGPASDLHPPHALGLTPHILVVDDSHTVRETQRRSLVRAGYTVTTAHNGQEAWNLLRLNEYDLLISDVDMPQMNGIELVIKVRENPRLARLPVIILSYKDREEDRRRGLEAGADFYLTKGSFQEESFQQAVVDLIGTAEPLPLESGQVQ